ncbi:MAG: ribosome silencing factor [Peptostreptococcaceae bacterium]|nr:ribosome silencing factor [Peptostreptococcaceae bacterium]
MNSREMAILAAKTLDSKKALDIICLDIESKSSIADYFILASGGSERQIKALSEEVDDQFAKEGLIVKSIEGKASSGWILLDYGDIIVSVLTIEMREKYNIEKVWGDCEILNWEE